MFARVHSRILNNLKSRFDSELFTYEQLRGMFIPLLLDQLFIFGIGVLSMAMVASDHIGAMTALNYAQVISNLANAIYSAVSVGASIVIARAKGSANALRMREAIGQSCVLCTLFGVLFGVPLSLFGGEIVGLVFSSANADIIKDAGDYLRFFGISIIFHSLFNVIFATFRSVGDTKSGLILTLIINTTHLMLSLIFINVLDLGVKGSGLSFMTARFIGLAFAVYWLMRPKCTIGMKIKDFTSYDPEIVKSIISLSIPFAIEQLLIHGGMLIVQKYISHLPVAQTDAKGTIDSMFSLYNAFGFGISTITNTVCGQCIGARNIKLTRKYCESIVFIGRFILLGALIVLYPLTPLIMKLYSPSPASVKYIYISLAIGAGTMPIFWSDANVIATNNRVAGDSMFTSAMSLLALAVGRVAFGYLFTVTLNVGIAGIWIGQTIEWIFRAVVFRLRLNSGKWVKVDLEAQS